jgi:hypothetical protein
MKRARLLAVLLALPLFSGCAAMTEYMKNMAKQQQIEERKKENQGFQMKGDITVVTSVAQRVLNAKGYTVGRTETHKGPDGMGLIVEGKIVKGADLGDMGKNVASNVATGFLLGAVGAKPAEQHVRKSTNTYFRIFINKRWAEDYENPQPNATVYNANFYTYDVDVNDKQYNDQAGDLFEADAVRDEIQRQVIAIYQKYNRKL